MLKANLPWIDSPFFKKILPTKNLSPEQEEMAKFYHANGYLKLSGLIPEDLIQQIKVDCKSKGFNQDFKMKMQRNETRVQDLWKYSEPARSLASFQPVLDVLQMLYDREPIPFQTLHFSKGSQQRAHSDTIHFSSLPAKFMCGAWVALEDVTLDNGPLFYYPGSQSLPEYNFSHIKDDNRTSSYDDYIEYEDFIEEILKVSEYKKEIFLAKKGDVLIWSSNLIHGGMPVIEAGSSRWSQVTHYFFKDCYYYTPMLSNMVTDELYLRNSLLNIKTKERVNPTYNGQVVNYIKSSRHRYIVNNGLSFFQQISLKLQALFKR